MKLSVRQLKSLIKETIASEPGEVARTIPVRFEQVRSLSPRAYQQFLSNPDLLDIIDPQFWILTAKPQQLDDEGLEWTGINENELAEMLADEWDVHNVKGRIILVGDDAVDDEYWWFWSEGNGVWMF